MAIQFRCEKCGKLLSVPGGSGGKTAQCPECGHAMAVPVETTSFGDSMPDERESNVSSAPLENPYASPSMEETALDEPTVIGELRHTQVSLGDLFLLAIRPLRRRPVEFPLFCLVMMGLVVLMHFAEETASELCFRSLGFGGLICVTLVFFVLVGWVSSGGVICFLRILRGEKLNYGDLLRGGPFLMRWIAFMLVYGLLAFAGAFIYFTFATFDQISAILLAIFCGSIGVWYLIGSSATICFVVDRDVGIVEAIRLSFAFMKKNMLQVFGYYLILWGGLILAGELFELAPSPSLRLGLGQAISSAFIYFGAVIYLAVTGQTAVRDSVA